MADDPARDDPVIPAPVVAGLPVPDRAPDTPILHGNAAEDADAYEQLWAEMAAWYGVQGPVETALLDRVVSLTWRLRRVPRAERGIVTQATVGLIYRRRSGRITNAKRQSYFPGITDGAMIETTNSVTATRAVQELQLVASMLLVGEGESPSWEVSAVFKPLMQVFGTDERSPSGIAGLGGEIGMCIAMWHTALQGVAPGAVRPSVALGMAQERLDDVIAMFEGLAEEFEREEHQRDRGAAEERVLPPAATLKGLADYERHLTRELREATAELERAIARRRLGEAARRAGFGRR